MILTGMIKKKKEERKNSIFLNYKHRILVFQLKNYYHVLNNGDSTTNPIIQRTVN